MVVLVEEKEQVAVGRRSTLLARFRQEMEADGSSQCIFAVSLEFVPEKKQAVSLGLRAGAECERLAKCLLHWLASPPLTRPFTA